jgi:hypothetical protein
MQRERNAALGIVKAQIAAFRAAISELGSVPEWSLTEVGSIENPSHFFVFAILGQRLRALSSTVRGIASSSEDSAQAARLRSLCDCAARLADSLFALDHASQDDVIRQLQLTRDYNVVLLSQVVSLVDRLDEAVGKALVKGRKQGGPRKCPELTQTISWLAEVYEDLGGTFTHTPYQKLAYDGAPHSAAGSFVVEFFGFCDPALTKLSISSAMAAVIKRRGSEFASS